MRQQPRPPTADRRRQTAVDGRKLTGYLRPNVLVTQPRVIRLLRRSAGILQGEDAALGQEGDELEEDYQCQVKNFHFNETSFLVLSQDRVIIIR